MPTLNDVLAGSLAQAVQVQQIIDALKGTPNKGVPISLVSLNDPTNYALSVQNDDPTNSRALLVLKADGTTLISADANGVTLGSPVNLPSGSINGSTALANGSVTNAKLASDTARLNLLTNGGFEIWQRGNGPFTGDSTGNKYSADRWVMLANGSDTMSVSRDTTHVDTSSVSSAAVTYTRVTGGSWLRQTCNEQAPGLIGATITLSVRVFTSTVSAVRLSIWNSSTRTQGAYHPGDGAWHTLTLTATVPFAATQLYLEVEFDQSCTAYVDNAMLVVGSQPADYQPMHPADDLARCLRYYEWVGDANGADIALASYNSGGSYIGVPLTFRAIKAVTPTVTKSGTWTVSNCAQPVTAGNTRYGCEIAALVSATGAANFQNTGAGTTITVEANP